ncbi:MAG: helix-turn-helix transcriptional regulator [Streptomycetaceae bacterium]|nr:helix-turn-helix transcriptional regulator [Streptomycetaceae bacterium]
MVVNKASNARKESELSLAVAAELRAERGRARVTIDELAAKTRGVSRGTLMKVLNGQVTADVTQLDAICRALGVRVIDIFLRAEEALAAAQREPGPDMKVAGE